MADLSAVLRKTIDGLPQATVPLRAKVYEKARGAINRQIDAANPPVSDEIAGARRRALEEAIERTEAYYAAVESLEENAGPGEPAQEARQAAPPAAASARPSPPDGRGRDASAERAGAGAEAGSRQALSAPSPAAEPRRSSGSVAAPNGRDAPSRTGPDGRWRNDPPAGGLYEPRPINETEPSFGLGAPGVAAEALQPPRSTDAAYGPRKRSGTPVLAGLAALLLLGGVAAAYVYRDDIQDLLAGSAGQATRTAAAPLASGSAASSPAPVPAQAGATASAPSGSGGGAPQATVPGTTPSAPSTPDAGSDVAALAPSFPPSEPGAAAPAQPDKPAAGRRFTQRLLPNGSEVDAGPGAGAANAFEEGTNVAAASPEAPAAVAPQTAAAAGAAPGLPDPSQDAAAPPATTAPEAGAAPAQVPATGPAAPTVTAALPSDQAVKVPIVSQKAVFYEERSETEQGTQQGGNVVWSLVNEAPAEGQPPEPTIRAVVDVPDEKIRMTMTIRRNADPTLPASHVIELMFDVPPNFAGGQIANVQRLALKPTEQARGEPLTGVAGKISDGFFIIALNNLTQAVRSNLDLLGKQQWIDIPIAYATGRRALMSIEKGIPGDRVFKQALDAWSAKT